MQLNPAQRVLGTKSESHKGFLNEQNSFCPPFLAYLFSFMAIEAAAQQSPNPVLLNPTGPQTIVQPSGTALDLVGTLFAGQNTNGTAVIDAYNGSAFYGNNGASADTGISINYFGNIGIGTPSAAAELSIVTGNAAGETGVHIANPELNGYSAIRLGVDDSASTGLAIHQFNINFAGDPASVFAPSSGLVAEIDAGGLNVAALAAAPIRFFAGGGNAGNEHMRITPTGFVGIGTSAPGAPLEVNGAVVLTLGSGSSITFPDSTVQATAWNGTTPGGDYAEAVDVLGERAAYEPGDVIAMDADHPGSFLKANGPYSSLVAGVYSTKPGLVGRRTTAVRLNKEAETPMAMIGIAPTKVCDENGPIKVGDLLVTSSRPGYAMREATRRAC